MGYPKNQLKSRDPLEGPAGTMGSKSGSGGPMDSELSMGTNQKMKGMHTTNWATGSKLDVTSVGAVSAPTRRKG